MEVVVSTLISVPTGILTSYLFWWWLSRRVAPRLAWSTALAIPAESSRTGTDHDQLRVKTVNLGRRDAVDLQINAQLRIPHEVDYVGSPVSLLDLPISVGWMPRLRRGSYRYIRMGFEQVPEPELRRIAAAIGSEHILSRNLAEFLRAHPDVSIRFYLFAYDAFSGARKMFVSPDYRAADLVEGSFGAGTSLTVTPAPPPPPPVEGR